MNTNGGNLTVLAGPGANNSWPNGSGTNDGTGSAAKFSFPESLWLDSAGNVFVADYNNDTIRKVTPAGVVTTVGGSPGMIGTADGTNSAARFNLMEGIFVDPFGNLYVADTQSSTIRIGYGGPPVIVSPPQNLAVAVGASPSFTVIAGGAAPRSAYQWRFQGVPLTNNAHISGAQTNVLTLASATTNDTGTYQVTVTNAYGPANVSATLTVTQAIPIITWTNPAAITYGTALGSTQLNATANVPGGLVYTPTTGAVLNVGTNVLSAVFTPTDTTNYTSAATNVSLVVNRAALTVTANNASRAYGQANPVFSGTITGVTNADNITATYGTTATTTTPVGPSTITPSLVDPGNRQTNYTVTLNNGTLTITQAIPIITWTNPASITYGIALSSTQLNAAANVPGAFAYTPTNGTVLNARTNTLSTVFTPTDATDYTSSTNTVSLVVNRAALTVTASNASRAYGQTNPVFSGTITGVTNADNITATYGTTATTTTPVGPSTITPSLVDPGDRQTNYTVTLNNGTLTITQAISIITWTNPASITYGTALSSTQLNAAANVPGAFAYTPTNGTLLPAGTNTLSAIFTPTDTTDYTGAATNVSFVVKAPAPVIQSVGRSSGSLTFTWSTAPGQMYQVLCATNVNQTNWTALGSAITATNSTLTASDAMTNAQRFYRIVLTCRNFDFTAGQSFTKQPSGLMVVCGRGASPSSAACRLETHKTLPHPPAVGLPISACAKLSSTNSCPGRPYKLPKHLDPQLPMCDNAHRGSAQALG